MKFLLDVCGTSHFTLVCYSDQEYQDDFLNLLKRVTLKRPRTVIDHILQHGQIATEELKRDRRTDDEIQIHELF